MEFIHLQCATSKKETQIGSSDALINVDGSVFVIQHDSSD